jgi:hypothetical protein
MSAGTDFEPGGLDRRAGAGPAARAGRGALGNGRLTALTGAVLLVLLAVEGATIPWIRPLLSVHIFLGILLLGPVALKLASTAYRFVRYYSGGFEYVQLGPPAPLMRVLVAPTQVLSTGTLFGSGVALLAIPHRGLILGLHKASFIVWFGAMAVHVLAYTARAGREALAELRPGSSGRRTRLLAVGLAVAVGAAAAALSYHLADPWFHSLAR